MCDVLFYNYETSDSGVASAPTVAEATLLAALRAVGVSEEVTE